nr:reverse transcriptase domain-containing protein [Tanacetum cinerariifolium]
MVATGGNIMRMTPQEAYDLIKNITQHHYQWDFEVQYDTTIDMSAYYFKTTFASSKQVEVLGNDSGSQFKVGVKSSKIFHPLTGSPTLSSDSIIASPSPSFTPLHNSDFLLEETDAFLALDSIPPGIDNEIFDAKGDIPLLKKVLNIDSTKDLPPQELNNDSEGDIFFLENLLEDELQKQRRSPMIVKATVLVYNPSTLCLRSIA